ncbi:MULTISPECIES: hypothetical protein [Acinetobacter]|uniref:hypothetical protein n=1 Tax=Acinetobacter TaxID=469 RepID=UPI0002D130E2|nr:MULTISPECIES: hypothetical protein [Acinetobacter]ENX60749.1 hypothetical protein F885_01857 [Acinetobacter higginsii]MCH7317639.1 hypothetical protein [Acinetobacter higginsii]MCI3881143.1 hypothetical protein [Acinetobacter higginsii]
MLIKDLLVIYLLLSVVLWAIFHQLAARYVNRNESLKSIFYGNLYKNKSMDVANIEAVILSVTFVNIIFLFSEKSLKNFFENRKLFYGLDFNSAMSVVEQHKKLWFYIKLSIFFGSTIVISSVMLFWL